jgi:hypothetical protein
VIEFALINLDNVIDRSDTFRVALVNTRKYSSPVRKAAIKTFFDPFG